MIRQFIYAMRILERPDWIKVGRARDPQDRARRLSDQYRENYRVAKLWHCPSRWSAVERALLNAMRVDHETVRGVETFAATLAEVERRTIHFERLGALQPI